MLLAIGLALFFPFIMVRARSRFGTSFSMMIALSGSGNLGWLVSQLSAAKENKPASSEAAVYENKRPLSPMARASSPVNPN
ncbi:hypothetical protein [Paenibacillus sp. P22]|uniref:hypothetical protein n=2 Tax=Paenibacillus TaxID=44249 RepID=UPI00038F5A7D|nr:hypothetical protein [Paenibacillus sp. P22]